VTLFVIRVDGRLVAAFTEFEAAELWSSFNLAFVEGVPSMHRIDVPGDSMLLKEISPD
jgi:hypothetical protein